MKFRIPGSQQGKDAGTPDSSASVGRQTESAKPASSVARSETGLTGASVASQAPKSSLEEVPLPTSHRLSVEVPSGRSGRPLSQPKTKASDVSDASAADYAFQVPETPPRGSGFGKHYLPKGFSLNAADDTGKPSENLPFPLAEEEGARHVLCQDSLMPWTYLLNIPGKNVRDILIDAFNDWMRCSPANLAVIKQVVGYLHTGSLIIDDIEDESATRRGEPAAHIVYGTARALNAGNYVYFLAMEKLLTLQSTECVMVFTNEMLNLHRGQGRDIFWRTTSYIATEEEYRQMVCDKTGGLFRLAIRFMQLLSSISDVRPTSRIASSSTFGSEVDAAVASSTPGRMMSPSVYTATSDFTALADQLACYFQVRDDLINLASPKFHEKKGFCEDITEGKLSFIALHSLRSYRDQKKTKEMDELLTILKSKTEDRKVMKRALTLMDNTKSFDHTVKYLKSLYSEIESSISSLGKNLKLSKLLEQIASEVDDCYDVRKRVIEAK